MKETIADKFANVSTLDRKDLWAYLVGEKESSAKIDITMPAYVVPETERKAGEVAMTETDAEGTNVLQLHTRNSILQCDKDFSAVLYFFGAKQVDGKKKREREPRVATLPTNRFGDVKEEQFYREAMGKGAISAITCMVDKKTCLYSLDNYLIMYVAKKAKDLSDVALYAAKFGSEDIEWLKLASNSETEQADARANWDKTEA